MCPFSVGVIQVFLALHLPAEFSPLVKLLRRYHAVSLYFQHSSDQLRDDPSGKSLEELIVVRFCWVCLRCWFNSMVRVVWQISFSRGRLSLLKQFDPVSVFWDSLFAWTAENELVLNTNCNKAADFYFCLYFTYWAHVWLSVMGVSLG